MIYHDPRDHRETRVLDCPNCEGGRVYTDDSFSYGRRCDHCGGTGKIEVEPEPMTLEEALDLDAEILAAQLEEAGVTEAEAVSGIRSKEPR